jgi:hypothetical protein
MLTFFLVTLVIIVVTVVPVMLGARFVGAQNTGFGSALFAVVVIGLVSAAIDWMLPSTSNAVRVVVSTAVGAALFAGVLGTTFLRGLAISAIAMVIRTVLVFVLVGALAGVATNLSA